MRIMARFPAKEERFAGIVVMHLEVIMVLNIVAKSSLILSRKGVPRHILDAAGASAIGAALEGSLGNK